MGICSLARNILGVERRAGTMGWGIGKVTSSQIFTRTCANQTTSWLMNNWSIFGAQTNHGQTWIHKTHHGL